MKTILLVDDDLHIGDMLEKALKQEGYAVVRAYSGTEALLVLSMQKPDLVLLDLMLPGLSGEEILPQMQDMPVIVMSAKADVDHKVDLLLTGAVDYVTKPFHIQELLARIAVQLRQRERPAAAPSVLQFEDLMLDLDTRRVYAAEQEVKLTRTEYAILKLLMQNPSQVITTSRVLESIARDTPDCTESSLKTHISHVRAKLRRITDKEYIEAVWGIGFKMKSV